jgi:hypothetical protein
VGRVGVEDVEPDEEWVWPDAVGGQPVECLVDPQLGGVVPVGPHDLGEALAEAGVVIAEMAGGDDGQGLIPGAGEPAGEGGEARRQPRVEVVDAVVLAVEAGHDGDEARVGDVESGERLGPDVALGGQLVEGGGEAGATAPRADSVGP